MENSENWFLRRCLILIKIKRNHNNLTYSLSTSVTQKKKKKRQEMLSQLVSHKYLQKAVVDSDAVGQ